MAPGRLWPPLILVVIVASFVACFPDFDDFAIGDGSDGDSDSDSDSDGDGDGDTGWHRGGSCSLPYLLVVVRGGDDRSAPDRVLRFSFGEEMERCGDITADGELLGQPRAAVWVDDDKVAVAGTDGVVLVDAYDDELIWGNPASAAFNPVDAFKLASHTQTPIVAIGVGADDGEWPVIDSIETYVIADGTQEDDWQWSIPGALSLGSNIRGLTSHPFEESQLLALDPLSYAAIEANPFAGTVSEEAYQEVPGSAELRTISSLAENLSVSNTLYRTVWVDKDGIYYLTHPEGDRPIIHGPVRCNNLDCEFVHAVGDPLNNHGLIGICSVDDEQTRTVVRFRSTNMECVQVISEAGVGGEQGARIARLGLAI